MKKRLLVSTMFFLLLTYSGFGQRFLTHEIYLDIEKGVVISGYNKHDSSFVDNNQPSLMRSESFKVFDFHSNGTLKFIFYDSSGYKAIEGQYLGSKLIRNNFLIYHSRRVSVPKGHPLTTEMYFSPLRHGNWKYFHWDGQLIKTVKYYKGQAQKNQISD